MMKKLANIQLDSPLILAPMAGITNMAFRTICMEHGASLVYAEMVSDKGLLYNNAKTISMLKVSKDEHPIAMQLFGSSVETLTEAAKIVEQECDSDIIDINMGCPVNKVIKSGSGSALLKEPEKIFEIIKSLKANIKKPITIKIRAGWDHESINCDEVGMLAEAAGVDAITIHTRTRSMMYRGNANLEYIKLIRKATNCFLIGNGDIKTVEDVKAYLDAGCDAVMIGRAALGNPWIFDKLKKELNGEEYIEPSVEEVIDTLLLHARRLIELTCEKVAMVEMRTHAVWYFKRLPNSKQYRLKLVNISNYEELKNICDEYKQKAWY